MEAKKSKNSVICTKRSEDAKPQGEGLNEPNGGYMKVEFEASGLRGGSRPERAKGWWAAKSTPSSTIPAPALEGKGIVFLVSGCRRGLRISGHKVRNALRPEIPPGVSSFLQ
jgi:hypothetical protein